MQTLCEVSVDAYLAADNPFDVVSQPEVCARCQGRDGFHRHGTYWRYVQERRQKVARFLCKGCRLTVSVLPAFVLPYRARLVADVDRYFEATDEGRRARVRAMNEITAQIGLGVSVADEKKALARYAAVCWVSERGRSSGTTTCTAGRGFGACCRWNGRTPVDAKDLKIYLIDVKTNSPSDLKFELYPILGTKVPLP